MHANSPFTPADIALIYISLQYLFNLSITVYLFYNVDSVAIWSRRPSIVFTNGPILIQREPRAQIIVEFLTLKYHWNVSQNGVSFIQVSWPCMYSSDKSVLFVGMEYVGRYLFNYLFPYSYHQRLHKFWYKWKKDSFDRYM